MGTNKPEAKIDKKKLRNFTRFDGYDEKRKGDKRNSFERFQTRSTVS